MFLPVQLVQRNAFFALFAHKKRLGFVAAALG